MKIAIATIKSWNIENAILLKEQYGTEHEIRIITEKDGLVLAEIDKFGPDYIFFPHWSYRIPADIYDSYNCIVFHMTDLPYGRGGSPLQNLIVRGFKETKISAIKVQKDIDAGPVYMKKRISLEGSAEEIYRRASAVIFHKMIPYFLENKIQPEEQQGVITYFKRRRPEESRLQPDMQLSEIYDYIRMLDAEGYPNAYINFGKFKLSFRKVKREQDKLKAEVMIVEEGL